MKGFEFIEKINDLDETMLKETEHPLRRKGWAAGMAVAACAVLLVGAVTAVSLLNKNGQGVMDNRTPKDPQTAPPTEQPEVTPGISALPQTLTYESFKAWCVSNGIALIEADVMAAPAANRADGTQEINDAEPYTDEKIYVPWKNTMADAALVQILSAELAQSRMSTIHLIVHAVDNVTGLDARIFTESVVVPDRTYIVQKITPDDPFCKVDALPYALASIMDRCSGDVTFCLDAFYDAAELSNIGQVPENIGQIPESDETVMPAENVRFYVNVYRKTNENLSDYADPAIAGGLTVRELEAKASDTLRVENVLRSLLDRREKIEWILLEEGKEALDGYLAGEFNDEELALITLYRSEDGGFLYEKMEADQAEISRLQEATDAEIRQLHKAFQEKYVIADLTELESRGYQTKTVGDQKMLYLTAKEFYELKPYFQEQDWEAYIDVFREFNYS